MLLSVGVSTAQAPPRGGSGGSQPVVKQLPVSSGAPLTCVEQVSSLTFTQRRRSAPEGNPSEVEVEREWNRGENVLHKDSLLSACGGKERARGIHKGATSLLPVTFSQLCGHIFAAPQSRSPQRT